ncbi:MAG: NAD(P)H-hydrate epimerase, partial [Clostridia bacterium]
MSVSTITPGNMRDMEKKFMQETGYPGLLLMEHAAQAVVHALLQFTHHTALFLCGTGNNGGDGMAAARLFAQAGGTPIVWLCGKLDALQHDARINGLLLKPLGIDTKELEEELPEMPISCDAVVDALFGTGLTRPLGGIERRVVSCISSWNIPVISIDIPSGVDAETGEDGGCAIHATLTVTFHRAKPGHYLYPGRQWTGRLVVADIGIPQTPEQGDGPILWTDEDIMRLLPPRAPDAHKGTFGHALIIAGSM